jgi:hypothetical protein
MPLRRIPATVRRLLADFSFAPLQKAAERVKASGR